MISLTSSGNGNSYINLFERLLKYLESSVEAIITPQTLRLTMSRLSSSLYFAILVIICLAVQTIHGLRILGLFPLAGKSHFIMSESLMRALAERGHQVDVYSHFPLKKPVPNYTDYSLAGSLPIFANNVSFEYFSTVIQGFSMSPFIAVGGNPTCEILDLPIFQKLIKDPPRNPPYDLVITQVFVANCYLAWGRHLNIPLVGLVTSHLVDWLHGPLGNPHNLAVDTSILSGYIAPMTFYERLKNFMITNYVKYTFEYYIREQDAYVEKNFGPGFPNVVELQKDVALVLANDHHAINGIKAYTPAVVPVGGLHITDTSEQLPQNVQRFLDESNYGFVYVSFGSMVKIESAPKPVLDAFYRAFKNIAPVRVLMKIAKPDELPAGLPSNVITQPWLPQITVLKHKNIKGFITHGGLLGTQESVYYGVPMVGVPLFVDQHLNIESYFRKNLAVKLDWTKMSEQSLTEAINAIIKNPVYKKSVDKVSKAFRDVPMSPRDVSVFWIEYIARHGKNALRSPLVDMPWWQASLLDVYGFIIIVVFLTLYILKRIFKFLIGKALPCRKRGTKLKKN